MKASKFTDARKVFIIQQSEDGTPARRYSGRRASARRRTSISGRQDGTPPPDLASNKPRRVFGRSGKGHFAVFYFLAPYRVTT